MCSKDKTSPISGPMVHSQCRLVATGLVENNIEKQLVYMIKRLTKHEHCFIRH